jgi:hypothetical protein
MLVFGEIISFEVPLSDGSIDVNSYLTIIFSVPGRPSESTLCSRGAVMHPTKGLLPFKAFVFNRPITQLQGQRLILQVVQRLWSGSQRLIGYGFCDLDVGPGREARDIFVPLWKPKTEDDSTNELCGTFADLADPTIATLPEYVDRRSLETRTQQGRVRIRIQRSGYS